ncbi:MAG: hypothetical protein ABI846_10745 [Rudaea sp.]
MAEPGRSQVLAAMGIEVLRLRGSGERSLPTDRAGTPAAAATDLSAPAISTTDASAPHAAAPRVLIVCAQGHRADARTARMVAQLPRALGTSAASIVWCEADARGDVTAPPHVPAYLVLGNAMAHALGAQLPTTQQRAAVIAVIGEPDALPADGSGKRGLWQALKPIARALRESA